MDLVSLSLFLPSPPPPPVVGVLQVCYGGLRMQTLFLLYIIILPPFLLGHVWGNFSQENPRGRLISPIWDIPSYCALFSTRYRASLWVTCPCWSQRNRNNNPS